MNANDSSIPPGAFSGLPLKSVCLDGQGIEALPATNGLQALGSTLQSLVIRHTPLATLVPGAFAGIYRMCSLEMNNNRP